MPKTQFNNRTATSINQPEFENIQLMCFGSNQDYEREERGIVLATRKSSGRFLLNSRAIAQLLEGAAIVKEAGSASLMARLGLLLFRMDMADLKETAEIDLTRKEVVELRDCLQVRMAHCEKERDERNDKFNPDTYIAMKFLLLDIREWLMIDAIGEFTPEKEPVEEPILVARTSRFTNAQLDAEVENMFMSHPDMEQMIDHLENCRRDDIGDATWYSMRNDLRDKVVSRGYSWDMISERFKFVNRY